VIADEECETATYAHASRRALQVNNVHYMEVTAWNGCGLVPLVTNISKGSLAHVKKIR
jgi:hypothetical protein